MWVRLLCDLWLGEEPKGSKRPCCVQLGQAGAEGSRAVSLTSICAPPSCKPLPNTRGKRDQEQLAWITKGNITHSPDTAQQNDWPGSDTAGMGAGWAVRDQTPPGWLGPEVAARGEGRSPKVNKGSSPVCHLR